MATPSGNSGEGRRVPAERPVRLFLSFAEADLSLARELEEHLALLKRQKIIESWHSRTATVGLKWQDEVRRQLEAADLVVLLISSAFIASDQNYSVEMAHALDRKHGREVRILPVLVRPCDWQAASFVHLPMLPRSRLPVTSQPDRDAAWTEIVGEIRTAARPRISKRRRLWPALALALLLVGAAIQAAWRAGARSHAGRAPLTVDGGPAQGAPGDMSRRPDLWVVDGGGADAAGDGPGPAVRKPPETNRDSLRPAETPPATAKIKVRFSAPAGERLSASCQLGGSQAEAPCSATCGPYELGPGDFCTLVECDKEGRRQTATWTYDGVRAHRRGGNLSVTVSEPWAIN